MRTLVRFVQLCLAESVLEAGCLTAVLGAMSAVKTVAGLLVHLVAVFADLQRIVTLLVLLRAFRMHPGPWRSAILMHIRLVIVGPIVNSLVLCLAYLNNVVRDYTEGPQTIGLTVTLKFLSAVNAILFTFWLVMVINPWLDDLTHKLQVTQALEPRTFVASASHTSETSCPICLSEVEAGNVVAQLPCGHSFHEDCIRNWLTTGGICPMRCPPPEPPADSRIGFWDVFRALRGLAIAHWHDFLPRWLACTRVVQRAATCPCQWCRQSSTGFQSTRRQAAVD
mmetsp:Transcript_45861/g.90992  ORF Transcript_45861/g.90992 Transcript_45861/m.90992 type:complete len:281 (-) Transcript_45861:257-1099(-)